MMKSFNHFTCAIFSYNLIELRTICLNIHVECDFMRTAFHSWHNTPDTIPFWIAVELRELAIFMLWQCSFGLIGSYHIAVSRSVGCYINVMCRFDTFWWLRNSAFKIKSIALCIFFRNRLLNWRMYFEHWCMRFPEQHLYCWYLILKWASRSHRLLRLHCWFLIRIFLYPTLQCYCKR